MARTTRMTLEITGYKAEVSEREVLLSATGRSYNQRDDRAYQLVLLIPREDVARVAELLQEVEAIGGAT